MTFLSFQKEMRFPRLPAPLYRFSSTRVGVRFARSPSGAALLPCDPWRTPRRSFQNPPGLLRIAHGKDNQLFLRTCLCTGVAVVDVDACVSKLTGSFGQCSGLVG